MKSERLSNYEQDEGAVQDSFVTRFMDSLPTDPKEAEEAEERYKGVTATAYVGTWFC